VRAALDELCPLRTDELVQRRYTRFRRLGTFEEVL
jgi:hypothetical protein